MSPESDQQQFSLNDINKLSKDMVLSGLSLSFSADVAKEDSLVTSHKNL